jgi:hypothetical protein
MSTRHANNKDDIEIEMNNVSDNTGLYDRSDVEDPLIAKHNQQDTQEGVPEEGGDGDMVGPSSRRRSLAHSFGEGDDVSSTGPERRLAARDFWRKFIANGTLIALWYVTTAT